MALFCTSSCLSHPHFLSQPWSFPSNKVRKNVFILLMHSVISFHLREILGYITKCMCTGWNMPLPSIWFSVVIWFLAMHNIVLLAYSVGGLWATCSPVNLIRAHPCSRPCLLKYVIHVKVAHHHVETHQNFLCKLRVRVNTAIFCCIYLITGLIGCQKCLAHLHFLVLKSDPTEFEQPCHSGWHTLLQVST